MNTSDTERKPNSESATGEDQGVTKRFMIALPTLPRSSLLSTCFSTSASPVVATSICFTGWN